MILKSTITCPHCAAAKFETMPTNACQFFYVCSGCGAKLRPKEGDCCVFCSYGSVACPAKQEKSVQTDATSCLKERPCTPGDLIPFEAVSIRAPVKERPTEVSGSGSRTQGFDPQLRALIGIEDFGFTVMSQGVFECLDAEACLHCHR